MTTSGVWTLRARLESRGLTVRYPTAINNPDQRRASPLIGNLISGAQAIEAAGVA